VTLRLALLAAAKAVFSRSILPQIAPALIAAAVFVFYWTWKDFLTPLIYLNWPKLCAVSLALRSCRDSSGQIDWGTIFVMPSLSRMPVFSFSLSSSAVWRKASAPLN